MESIDNIRTACPSGCQPNARLSNASKFDSMDFVQSVWLSFFKNRAAIADFQTASQLVAFLATAARNKVCTESRRRLYTQKHDIRRECAWWISSSR